MFSALVGMRRRRLSRVATAVMLALSVCCVLQTEAHAKSGTAAGVDPEATAQTGSSVRTLTVGSDISVGDRVITGATGQVQILFSDDTRMVVGPDSSLLIQDYLLRGDNTVSKFAVKALGGTFRFITGKSPKEAYTINTPAGTIGVRGSAADIAIDRESGVVSVVRLEGKIILCPYDLSTPDHPVKLKCVVLTQVCSTGEIPPASDAHIIEIEADRLKRTGDLFPYIESQTNLLSRFRVPYATQCSRPLNPPAPEKHPGGGEPGSSSNYCEGECCEGCG